MQVRKHQLRRMGLDEILALVQSLSKQNLCEKSSKKIMKMLLSPRSRAMIAVELAAAVEIGEATTKATFDFEVAAPMAPVVGDVVEELSKCTRTGCATTAVFSGCVFQAF